MNETGIVLISIGILFDIFGCIGLCRLPDVYNRLQAATKCVTLGTCFIILGMAFTIPQSGIVVKALICIAFILLTSPVSAHALARAAHRYGIELYKGSIVDMYKKDDEGKASEQGGDAE